MPPAYVGPYVKRQKNDVARRHRLATYRSSHLQSKLGVLYANAAARAHLASAAKSLRDAEEVQAAAEDRYKRDIGTVVEIAQTSSPSNYRGSLAAYGASTALTSAAQTTFNSALAAYRNGVGSITDVTTAERQLLAARNAATDAYSTALSATATLALSAGVLDLEQYLDGRNITPPISRASASYCC